jgi:hypothetical protein
MNDDNYRPGDRWTEDRPTLTPASKPSQRLHVPPAFEPPAAQPPMATSASWWSRLLDGDQVWGSMDISLTRYGVTRYRLVVFPPGIDGVERRLLRALRAWPTWGVALWFFAICVCSVFTPWVRFALPSLAWLGIGAYLFARAGALRARVQVLSVTRAAGLIDPEGAAIYAEIKTLVTTLRSADDLRQAGGSSAAEHEAVWWEVYERLARDHPRTTNDAPSM